MAISYAIMENLVGFPILSSSLRVTPQTEPIFAAAPGTYNQIAILATSACLRGIVYIKH